MDILYSSKDNDECTTNSNYGYKHNNYTGKRKKSNFNINLNLKNSFVLFFTLSIIITSPFGILSQIQIQTTEALHPSVINDNISGMRDKTNGNSNDNDDSIDSNDNDINQIVIVRDDKPGTELSPTETIGLEIDAQSSSIKSYRDHVNSNANENANVNSEDSIIVPDDKPGTELSPTATTESQIDIQSTNKVYRDHVNSNANENANENVVVSQDKTSTESSSTAAASSQSQISAQSSNEVYGDFNGDGRDDLAIGVHDEDVVVAEVTISAAGAVNVLYGNSNGLSATSPIPDQFWTQSTMDVNDLAELGDNFGLALS